MEVVQMKSQADNSNQQEGKVSMRDFVGTAASSANVAKKEKNQ
jgi:hypothetical protein